MFFVGNAEKKSMKQRRHAQAVVLHKKVSLVRKIESLLHY
jgi:hypothetical protein